MKASELIKQLKEGMDKLKCDPDIYFEINSKHISAVTGFYWDYWNKLDHITLVSMATFKGKTK